MARFPLGSQLLGCRLLGWPRWSSRWGVLVRNGFFRWLETVGHSRSFRTDFVSSNRAREPSLLVPSGTLFGRKFLSPACFLAAACRVGSCRAGNTSCVANARRRGRDDPGNTWRYRTTSRTGKGGWVATRWFRDSAARSDPIHGPSAVGRAGRVENKGITDPTIRWYRCIDREPSPAVAASMAPFGESPSVPRVQIISGAGEPLKGVCPLGFCGCGTLVVALQF